MISLFIDTANFRLTVGIIDENENKILSIFNEKIKNDLSVKIFEIIQECINNANVKIENINKIYSVIGPGSYTGIRIGVTICKTFAWSKNIKVIPISSLEVIASTNTDYDYILSAIDARRNCVYAGLYNKEMSNIIEDKYIEIEKLKNEINKYNYITVTDDDIMLLGKSLKSDIDLIKIVNKHKNDCGVNPHNLNPNYLKITEAEANRK